MSDEPELDGFAPGARPICGFCNAPWSDDMLALYAQADCANGYYGPESPEWIETTVDITCGKCERLIYRKEISVPNYGWGGGKP